MAHCIVFVAVAVFILFLASSSVFLKCVCCCSVIPSIPCYLDRGIYVLNNYNFIFGYGHCTSYTHIRNSKRDIHPCGLFNTEPFKPMCGKCHLLLESALTD